MEERERMLDTIMEMQRCNIFKDEQINELELENQALKDRWNKLKEWVVKEQGFTSMYQEEKYNAFDEIKDKMQELEKGETNGSK